jgi:hypothetical protein
MKASDAKRYWHDGGSNQNGTNSAVVEGYLDYHSSD